MADGSRQLGDTGMTAIAVTIEPTEGSKIATSTMASAKLGTDWNSSVKRISTASTQPPK